MRRAVVSGVALLLAALLIDAASAAGLCTRWSAPEVLGQLDVRLLTEASGIAVAPDGEQLYLHNDGNQAAFFVTDRHATIQQQVEVDGFRPEDVEDVALGRCGVRTCLFLADVGDNAQRRTTVQIAVIEQPARFGAHVTPRAIVEGRYPDGPHNAEAIAMHPSGDMLLLTKSGSGLGQADPARVYRLTAEQLAAGGAQQFEFRGEIPVSTLTRSIIPGRRVVTSMDIAPDGKRFVLLTYDSAIEIAADLGDPLPAPAAWTSGQIHQAVPSAPLIQAEAVAFDRDGRSLLYTTESVNGSVAPLIRQGCSE